MRSLTIATLLALWSSVAFAGAPARQDMRALAEKVVSDAAHVKEGDFVLITGTFDDRELLEELAVAVRRAGGNPLISVDSDAMLRRFFVETPEKYDRQAGAMRSKLADFIDVRIRVDRGELPDGAEDVPASRLTVAHESYQAVNAKETSRGVRRVVIGNGLFPTPQVAQRLDLTLEQLSTIFWKAVSVDYKQLSSVGQKARAALAGGKVLELTAKNGTSLRMRIEGRPVFVSDGVISPEDLKKGGAATLVWLPAGEVYLTPIPGTVEGKVVVDRQVFQNAEVLGLTLEIKGGKLVSMTAKSGLEPLKQEYDAAPAGKELFGLVDLGINPNVSVPKGSRLLSYLPAGMVMVSLGGNRWAGGDNDIVYTLDSFLPGCTVKVDGKVIVQDGVLKL